MDRSVENLSKAVRSFCLQNGVDLEPTATNCPQSNGAVERLIQEHWTRARVMMFASNMLNILFPEAIQHFNWTLSLLPELRIDAEIPMNCRSKHYLIS